MGFELQLMLFKFEMEPKDFKYFSNLLHIVRFEKNSTLKNIRNLKICKKAQWESIQNFKIFKKAKPCSWVAYTTLDKVYQVLRVSEQPC